MTPERMRQLAAEVVLGAARCPARLDVRDRLADLQVPYGEREALVLAVHELALRARVEVSWPDEETAEDYATAYAWAAMEARRHSGANHTS